MKKVKLFVTEELKYRREIIADVPDSMSDESLERALDKAQGGAESADDFAALLKRSGIVISESWDDSMDSPDFGEVECDDYTWIEQPEAPVTTE